MPGNTNFHCALCKVHPCAENDPDTVFPAGCPTTEQAGLLAKVKECYRSGDVQRIYQAAARTEARGYGEWPRVREIAEFAKLNGYRRLGLAFCIGLSREAAVAAEIFAHHGFEVYSACCNLGRVPKEEMGVPDADKVQPGRYETGCNPLGQAAVLGSHATDLNVVMGLCVGHDTLFIRSSKAPVTVLVAKDRVTGHNPVAALHNAHGYLRKRVFGE